MDFVVLELILWAGLIFFFWALKDNLGRVESDIEAADADQGRGRRAANSAPLFAQPDQMLDLIGHYLEYPIFRYAVFSGKQYRFDHVLPNGCESIQSEHERCIAPGLVYVACEPQ